MTHKTTRRHFLKTTATAGASIIILKDLLANESPNEKIAFASVGLGGKGLSDSGDAANSGEMVAVCDTNRHQLNGALGRFENAKPFEDYRVMFDEMGDKIDAFTVTTSDHMHGIISAHGMKLGKHCFCQKPLTRTVYEARRLGEIAREMNVVTQQGNQGSADSGLRERSMMVRAGILGDVKEVYIWTSHPVWPQGAPRGQAADAPPDYVNWDSWIGVAPMRPFIYGSYDPFSWRGWWDFGTGALGDNACHSWNLPYAGLDLTDLVAVQAVTSGHDHDYFPKWTVAEFEFAAKPWRPGLKLIWMDGGKKPDPALLDGHAPVDNGHLIVGEKGKLYGHDFLGIPNTEIDEFQKKADYPRSSGHFSEFAEAIRENNPAKCWANFPNHAAPVAEAALAGNLAVWGASEPEVMGPRVKWDAKTMTITNDPPDKERMEALVRPTFREGYEMF